MSFAAYDPYTSKQMADFKGNPAIDAKYMNDPLIQKLLMQQVQQQIIGAFTPQSGGVANTGFLDKLLNPSTGGGGGGSVIPPVVTPPTVKPPSGGGGTYYGGRTGTDEKPANPYYFQPEPTVVWRGDGTMPTDWGQPKPPMTPEEYARLRYRR